LLPAARFAILLSIVVCGAAAFGLARLPRRS
jgi:hypothetical protein